MNGYDCDGGDDGDHRGKHDEDEPCGAVCCLGRGLSYSHGVDKGSRYEPDELHLILMVTGRDSSRKSKCRCFGDG